MDEKHYLYNGELYSYSLLKQKYGDSTDAKIKEHGFEDAYEYNGEIYGANMLKEKYGDNYATIAKEKGIYLYGEKKKEDSQVSVPFVEQSYEPSSGPLKDEYKLASPSPAESGVEKKDKFTTPNIPLIENDAWIIPQIPQAIPGVDENGNEISVNPRQILNDKLQKYQEPVYNRTPESGGGNVYFNDAEMETITQDIVNIDKELSKTAKPGKSGFLVYDPALQEQRDVLVRELAFQQVSKLDAVKKEIGKKYYIDGNPVLFSEMYAKTMDPEFITNVKDGKVNVEIYDDNELATHLNKQTENVGAWGDAYESLIAGASSLGAGAVNLPDFLWQTIYTVGSGGEVGKLETDNVLRDKLLAVSKDYSEKQFVYKDGIIESLKQGNVSDALKQTANAAVGSLPYSVMAAGTMGLGTIPASMVMTGISASERSLNNQDITTNDYGTELAYDWAFGAMEGVGEALGTRMTLIKQADTFTKNARSLYQEALQTGSKEAADKYITALSMENATKLIKDVVKNTGSSITEEAISEMITSVGQDLAGNITGAVEPVSVSEIVDKALESGFVGGVSGGGMAQIGNIGLAAAALQNKNDRERLTQLNSEIKLLGNKILSSDVDNKAKVKLLKMASDKRLEQFEIFRQKREQAERLDKEEIEKLTQNVIEQKSIVDMLTGADEQFAQILNERLSEIEKENQKIVATSEITPQAEVGFRGVEQDVDMDVPEVMVGKVFENEPQEVTNALELFGKKPEEVSRVQDMYSRGYDLTIRGIKDYFKDIESGKLKPVTRPLVPKKESVKSREQKAVVEPIKKKKPILSEIEKEGGKMGTPTDVSQEQVVEQPIQQTQEQEQVVEQKETEILIEKPKEDAVQEQKPDESVLHQEGQELGLQEVEQGNAEQEITTKQSEAVQKEIDIELNEPMKDLYSKILHEEKTPISPLAGRISAFSPKQETEGKPKQEAESKPKQEDESKSKPEPEQKKAPLTMAERIAAMSGEPKQQETKPEQKQSKLSEIQQRIKEAKDKRKQIKDKKKGLGIVSDSFKDAEEQAKADRELIDAYIDLARYYIKEGVDNFKQFIKKLREGNDDVEEDIAKKAWNKANLTTGEERRSSLKQRIKENLDNLKNAPLLKEKIEKEGVSYDVENQGLAWSYAEYIIDEVGFDGALQMVESGDIKGATATLIYGMAIDKYGEQIKNSKVQSNKAIFEERRNELIDKLAKKNREDGRANSAMHYWCLRSPSGLAAMVIKEIDQRNETELTHGDPKNTKRQKIKDVNKEIGKERGSASKEAAEKVVNKGKDKEKPKEKKQKKELSPEKKARRDELAKKYRGIFNDITNMVRLLSDKEFIEYGALLIEEGYITFEEFSKEAVRQLGKKVKPIVGQWYKKSGGKDDLALYEAEQKKKKAEQKSDETSAEKLAKQIVSRIREPRTSKFDPIKEMLTTLMGKVDETLTQEKPENKGLTAIEKIKMAILGFDEYKKTWDESKLVVDAMIDAMTIDESIKEQYREQLSDYVNEKIGVPFGKREAVGAMREVIGSGLTKMVRQYVDSGVDLDIAIDEIVEKIAFESGMVAEDQIDAVRRDVVEKFGEINSSIADAKLKAEAKRAEVARQREKAKEEKAKEKERTGGINKPVWGERRKGVINAVISKLESKVFGKDKQQKTAVEEFAARLKERMLSQIPDKAPDNRKRNYIDIIKEALLNPDIYEHVVEQVREDITNKYKDNPSVLLSLDDALFGISNKPFSNSMINSALRDSLMKQLDVDNTPDLNDRIIEILSSSTENKNNTKQQLIDRAVSDLIDGTNITQQQALVLAESFADEYENIMREKAKSLLKRALPDTILDTVRNKAKRKKKTEVERMVDQIMWGAFNDSEFEKKFLAKYGLTEITDEQKATILQLAEDAMNEPEGSDARYNKLIDLDLYKKYIVKQGLGFMDIFVEMNYNNILMAMDTYFGALLYNVQQTFGIDVALAVLRNPKNASLIFDAAYKNRRDGKVNLNKSAIEGIDALQGKITGKKIREKSLHETSVGKILEKYGKNKATRMFGKYLQTSSKVLSGIDASTSARSADIRLMEMIADHTRKENKKLPKDQRLSEQEVKQFTRFILGYSSETVTDARLRAEEEFKKRYNVSDMSQLSKEQMNEFKSQVLHYIESDTERRAYHAYEANPLFKSLIADNQLEYYIQQSQKYGNMAALMGKPPGTLGVVAAGLQNSLGQVPIAKLTMVPFINASMNLANLIMMGNPLTGAIRIGESIAGKRIIGSLLDEEGLMYKTSKLDIELSDHDRRDIITKVVVFNILSQASLIMMVGADDEDYEEGVANGKWKNKKWFITGGMYGGKQGWQNNEEEREKNGLEPYTLYYKGAPIMDYKMSPLIAIFGFAGAFSDYKYFRENKKSAEKTLFGKYIGSVMIHLSMIKDASMLTGLADSFDALFGQNRYSELKNLEKVEQLVAKNLGQRLRSFVFPREFLTLNRDVKALMDMDNKKADELFEYFAQDVPFLEDMVLDESGYDKFGDSIKEQFKRRGIPLRVFDGDIIFNGQRIINGNKYYKLYREKNFDHTRFKHRDVYTYEPIDGMSNNLVDKETYVYTYEIPVDMQRKIDREINVKIKEYIDGNWNNLVKKDKGEFAKTMREVIGSVSLEDGGGIRRDVYNKYFGEIDLSFRESADDVNPDVYKGE